MSKFLTPMEVKLLELARSVCSNASDRIYEEHIEPFDGPCIHACDLQAGLGLVCIEIDELMFDNEMAAKETTDDIH